MTVTSASGITDYTVQGNNVTQTTTDSAKKPLQTDDTTKTAANTMAGTTAVSENEKTAAAADQDKDDATGKASNEALKDG